VIDKLIALGVISVSDLEDVGAEPLVNELNIAADLAAELVAAATEESKRSRAESKQRQAENLLQQQMEPADNQQQAPETKEEE
jgi:N utilization substance protein A